MYIFGYTEHFVIFNFKKCGKGKNYGTDTKVKYLTELRTFHIV